MQEGCEIKMFLNKEYLILIVSYYNVRVGDLSMYNFETKEIIRPSLADSWDHFFTEKLKESWMTGGKNFICIEWTIFSFVHLCWVSHGINSCLVKRMKKSMKSLKIPCSCGVTIVFFSVSYTMLTNVDRANALWVLISK